MNRFKQYQNNSIFQAQMIQKDRNSFTKQEEEKELVVAAAASFPPPLYPMSPLIRALPWNVGNPGLNPYLGVVTSIKMSLALLRRVP